MTTREIFFKKLYEKSENFNVKISEDLTNEEKKFIDKLSFFSKHNKWLKSYFCSSNKKTIYKRQYLNVNSGYLKYNDFIELERCYENYKDFLSDLPYSLLIGTLFFSVIDIFRLKMNYELGPIFKRALFISFSMNFVHYIWFREKFYKPVLNYHYDKLSEKINGNNIDDNDNNDKNNDLVKNYFIKI